jgi:hypothetical protein
MNMSFLSRIMRLVPAGSHVRREPLSTGRRRSRIELETLPGRALLSGLTGVSLSQYGALVIDAPSGTGHNTASVTIDPSNNFVKVSLNAQSEEFNPSVTPIYNVTYLGGQLGHDTFADDTSIISREYGYGSGNNFTGGTGLNYVYFDPYLGVAGGNTYTAEGAASCSDVFEIGGGTPDTVNNPNHGIIQLYLYA